MAERSEEVDAYVAELKSVRIQLVYDEVLALEYLRGLIDWEMHGFRVEGCACSARKALAMYESIRPEVVISDIKMAGMDGLELAARLKEKNPDIVVVLLSAYQDFEYAKSEQMKNWYLTCCILMRKP